MDMELKGKKVLVFGSGKSGIGAAHLLLARGAVPVIYDGNEKADRKEILDNVGRDVEIILGMPRVAMPSA